MAENAEGFRQKNLETEKIEDRMIEDRIIVRNKQSRTLMNANETLIF